jgi:hypothetical protein
MLPAQEWSDAAQHPEAMNLKYTCVQEHVLKATDSCTPPPGLPVVIVVGDERGPQQGAFLGIGEVITRHDHGQDASRAISAGIGAALTGT